MFWGGFLTKFNLFIQLDQGVVNMVTYLGSKDILIDQPVVLVGTYDPQKHETVAVIAEDKYVLTVDFNAKAGIGL